jgi:hypothetical protein
VLTTSSRDPLPGVDAIMNDDPLLAEVSKIETDALYTASGPRSGHLLRRPQSLARHPGNARRGCSGSLDHHRLVEGRGRSTGAHRRAPGCRADVRCAVAAGNRAQAAGRRLPTAGSRRSCLPHYRPRDPGSTARRVKLDELIRRRAELNARNRPSDRAFKRAQKKIDSGDLAFDGG